MISAHWYINATAVTAMRKPRTIHDFYGFPPELFAVQYPAPGLPELAAEISDAVHPTWVGADVDSWGIDHGTWSVLLHAFPDASIPVVQLSINADKPLDYHLELGAKLAPLRERGVLIVASGNVVHNLGGMNSQLADAGYDWAQRFDEEAKARMLTDPTEFATLDAHRDFRHAVPTPDHFIPALYLAGLAGATDTAQTEVLVDGYAYGSLSMTAYTLGLSCPAPGGRGRVAAVARRRPTRGVQHLTRPFRDPGRDRWPGARSRSGPCRARVLPAVQARSRNAGQHRGDAGVADAGAAGIAGRDVAPSARSSSERSDAADQRTVSAAASERDLRSGAGRSGRLVRGDVPHVGDPGIDRRQRAEQFGVDARCAGSRVARAAARMSSMNRAGPQR